MEAELGTFEYHGIDISGVNGSKQVETTCPFCDKEKHFFISAKSQNAGQWECKHCGQSGNRYTFLQLFYEHWHEKTGDDDYKRLAKERKSSKLWQGFRTAALAYDSTLERWLIPTYNAAGSLVDLQTWQPGGHLQHTKGCKAHLFGIDNLKDDGPIFITEGAWDAITLAEIFPQVDERERYSIVAVPGWDSLCTHDIGNRFANRDIVLLYDSGLVGPKNQEKKPTYAKHGTLLSREHHARSVQAIHWPESYPDNYDITDLVNAKGAEKAWSLIKSYLRPISDGKLEETGKKALTFDEVVNAFKRSGVHVTRHFSDAMAVVFSSILSVQLGGKPLWIFLIGVPGAGKSLILEATLGSATCEYQTDLKYESMLSGYKDGSDPSILARLGNRALVVKDYTTILDKGQQQQQELLALMREAYDGRIVRTYGNNVTREYPPPESGLDYWYFAFVAGTTPQLHKHVKAAMGEAQRFLKCEMRPAVKSTDLIRRAISNVGESWQENEKAMTRQNAVKNFLDNTKINPKSPPSINEKWREEIVWLTQFTINCRAHLERERDTQDLMYEASTESGARLGEQLTKLSQSLAVVLGKRAVDDEVFRLVRKVAWDTAFGKRRTIFSALWQLRGSATTTLKIAKKAKVSLSGTRRELIDLRDLGIATVIESKESGGRPADFWQLTKIGREIGQKSRVFQQSY